MVVEDHSYGWRMRHAANGHDDRVMSLALALHAAEERAYARVYDFSRSGNDYIESF